MLTGATNTNIFIMIGLTICLHITGGFVFNVVYGYCLGRFSKNAGIAAGLTGGGMYIVSSFISYGLVSLYGIRTQTILGVSNIIGVAVIIILFAAFGRFGNIRLEKERNITDATMTS